MVFITMLMQSYALQGMYQLFQKPNPTYIESFNTSWIPRFPIVANGYNVQDLWAKKIVSYLSIGVPHSKCYVARVLYMYN